MADNDAAPGATEVQTLKTTDAHASGTVCAVWLAPKEPGQLAVLTAGSDGVLSERQIRPTPEVKWKTTISRQHPVTALSLSPDQTMGVVVVNKTHVKMMRLNGDINEIHDAKAIAKFPSLPTHCCEWGKDGHHVLVAGDDGVVKVVQVPAGKVKAQMKPEAFMRGAAMDPEGRYAAAATTDGQVMVWDLSQIDKGTPKVEYKRNMGCKVDHDDAAARVGMAWHPNGMLLAVAGQENDVLLLERYDWHCNDNNCLVGGHTGSVRLIAFSPNGLYVATAGEDGRVVIWLQDNKAQVAMRALPAPASSLCWHPSANMLLCGTTAGSFAIWPNTVPTDIDPTLPSPYKSLDEVDKEADVAAEKAADKAAADAGGGDDMLDDDDDDEPGAGIRRRRLKKAAGAAAQGGDDALADMLDELDAAMEEAAGIKATHHALPGSLYPRSGLSYAPKPKKPQDPIHPGSTPAEDSEGGEVAARFLAYNQLGCVLSKAGEGHNFIEVQFRDTSKHRGVAPKFTEMYGFTAASLGPKGVAYISPAAGEDRPSVLMYRAFESWCGEKEWTVALPAGEEALVVAAGSSGVAVATSKQVLRLYSLAGRQLSIMSLQGPPVALVAAGAGVSGVGAACEHHLAVVWAQGPPEPLNNTQQLAYTVFDASCSSQVASGSVVLSPGASLTWLAFSAEGLLAAMDSTGAMRMRTPDWGGSWVPVLDAASAKESCGSDSLWPVCLDSCSLTAVVTTKQAPYPQVLPLPLHSQVALSPPLAAAAEAAPEHEGRVVLQGVMAAHIRSLESDGVDVSDELNSCLLEMDKSSLRAFTAYLKAGKQARALEVAQGLHAERSLEGAKQIAGGVFKLNVLAERITAIIEQRQCEEQQAAAAAAAAQQAVHLLEDQGVWEAEAQAAGDDDMQGQPDQIQQTQASQFASSLKQPAAPNPQGGKVPAMFGVKSAAGGTGAGGGGGVAVKRTAGAAGLGSAAASKGTNPFARKKAK